MENIPFESLITRYQRLVYSVCYQYTHNHHTAEDLAQDTFVSAYLHMGSCPAENPAAWLARIAANKAKDFLKSAYNRRVASWGEEAPPDAAPLYAAGACLEDTAALRAACQSAGAGIARLDEPYRRVAELFFLADCAPAEIAQRLGRPKKTVHSQIHRARAKLQAGLCGWRGAAC